MDGRGRVMPTVAKKKPAKKKTTRKSSAKKSAAQSLSMIEAIKERFSGISSSFGAIGAAIAVLALIVLVSGGYIGRFGDKVSERVGAMTAAAGYEVRRVTVKGLSKTSEDDLLAALGPIIGEPLLRFDHHTARALSLIHI